MKRASRSLAVAAAVLGWACGGGGDGGGPGGTGTCTPTTAVTVTLTSSGVSPKAVCVLPDGTVTFVNTDTVAHDIQSDGSCPAANVGPIPPSGGTRVATFATAQTCNFHDASNPQNAAFQGTVAVSAEPTQGPGY